MNQWLASVYGTGDSQEQDLEKVAQSMLLQKLAEAEGVSLDGLSAEQLDALAAEVVEPEGEGQQAQGGQQRQQIIPPQQGGGQPGMIAQAGEGASEEEVDEEGGEELSKEAQAKFMEADFLGRTMAHAYTQELQKIAAVPGPSFARKAGNFALKAKMKGRAAGEDAVKAVGKHVGEHKKKYIGGAAAAGGAAAFGAGRMSKEASSPILEKLAQIRAAEMLTEAGIDPATGQPLQAEGEEAAEPAEQQVQQAVDNRAVELLKAAGYRFK